MHKIFMMMRPQKTQQDAPSVNHASIYPENTQSFPNDMRLFDQYRQSKNANPTSPPESPNSFLNRKVREFNTLLESLNLAAPPLEREHSCLERYVGFVKLFKEFEIRDVRDEEIEEEEVVVEVEELGNFTYIMNFLIVEDISSIIDPCLSDVLLGKPFIEIFNMTYDASLGIVKFTNGVDEVAYQMPHKIEQFQSLSNMEKEHKQSVYFRNDEDKKRSGLCDEKDIFYKECLELGPEYKTNNDGSSSVSEEGVM
ncbi:hypothetical protein Tco_0246334 [Tanacetum coccineum]